MGRRLANYSTCGPLSSISFCDRQASVQVPQVGWFRRLCDAVIDEYLLCIDDYEIPPLNLYELRWEAKEPPTTPLLLWVLGKSKESLRVLHLCRLPREDWENQLA